MTHAREIASLVAAIHSTGPDPVVMARIAPLIAAAEARAAQDPRGDPLQERRQALLELLDHYENGLDVAGADSAAMRFANYAHELRRDRVTVAATLNDIVCTYTADNGNADVAAAFIDVVFPSTVPAGGA